LPYRPNGTSTARNNHNKDRIQTVLPCRPDGCNSSPHLALLRIASEHIAMTSKRMQP